MQSISLIFYLSSIVGIALILTSNVTVIHCIAMYVSIPLTPTGNMIPVAPEMYSYKRKGGKSCTLCTSPGFRYALPVGLSLTSMDFWIMHLILDIFVVQSNPGLHNNSAVYLVK